MDFIHQTAPFIVPTTDGKSIMEFFGAASTGQTDISIAHMVAPGGWSEPAQIPLFDEYTFMIKGKKIVRINDVEVLLSAGESLLVKAGSRVQYANPFAEPAEYVAVCKPAFKPELANRESEN